MNAFTYIPPKVAALPSIAEPDSQRAPIASTAAQWQPPLACQIP